MTDDLRNRLFFAGLFVLALGPSPALAETPPGEKVPALSAFEAEALRRKVLQRLTPGTEVNLTSPTAPIVYGEFDPRSAYSVMAKKTGGIVTHGREAELAKLVQLILAREQAGVSPGMELNYDIVFVVDTTSSLHQTLEYVKAGLHDALEVGKSASHSPGQVRFGLATFDDRDKALRQFEPIRDDFSALAKSFTALRIGYSDTIVEEKVYDAVIAAIQKTPWRSGTFTRRIVIPISDADPRENLLDGRPGLPVAIQAAQDEKTPVSYYPFIVQREQIRR